MFHVKRLRLMLEKNVLMHLQFGNKLTINITPG